MIGKQPKLFPVGYRESMTCYGHNTTRRRYRSTVEYRPKKVPERYSDTCYIRPKSSTNTFVSYLDVGADDHFRRKWFTSAVHVEPRMASNVVVGGFEWLSAPEQTGEWTTNYREGYESGPSSGICSEDEGVDELDWTRSTDRQRIVNINNRSTTLVVPRKR